MNKKIFLALIGLLLILFIFNFRYINNKSEVKYIPGKIIHDTIIQIATVREYVPSDTVLLTYRDTIYIDSITYITNEVDSLAVLRDWLTRRDYVVKLFENDSVGTCSVNISVYQNKVDSLSYEFKPIYAVVTKKSDRIYYPYVGIGLNTSGAGLVQVGVFKNHWGLNYQLTKDFTSTDLTHGLSVIYKF